MVLFRPTSILRQSFDKQKIIEDIITMMRNNPSTHILRSPSSDVVESPDLYDLLIIQNRFFEVKKVIGQYDGLNTMRLQQVFAIKVCDAKEKEKMSDNETAKVRDWVTQYIITDNVKDVIRIMEKD